MPIDLALLGVVALFGLLGFLSGAIRQLSHWVGLAIAYFACRPLAAQLTPWLASRLGFPAAGVRVATAATLFALLCVIGSMLIHAILLLIDRGREGGRVDRSFGFVLGAAKGAAILFVLISGVLFFEKPLTELAGTRAEALQRSKAVALVRRHNLFEAVPFPVLAKLERVMEAARDPKRAKELGKDSSLLRDPAVKAALHDKSLMRALAAGDGEALRANPGLAKLLDDPRLKREAEQLVKRIETAAKAVGTAEPDR